MKLVCQFSSRWVFRTTTAFVVLLIVGLLVLYNTNLPAKQPDVKPLLDFGKRPFTFYTISHHAATINDLTDLLGPLGVRFIDKAGWTYVCKFFNSCRSGDPQFVREVGRPGNWFTNASLIDFYEKHKNDRDVQTADAFICMHPAATCGLFEMFNKPIVILLTIRPV